tara:strand:- start:71 stop:220 length:150 start_codon:yes stop_codon:yes gene_type:complete
VVGVLFPLDLVVAVADTMVVDLVVHQLEMVLKQVVVDQDTLIHHMEVLP